MNGCSCCQRREFPLDNLVEVVGGRKRTRRLNRRKDRHLGLRIIAVGQDHICGTTRRKLAACFFILDRDAANCVDSLPSTYGHPAMQHTNKGDVEGRGTWMAAWRPLTSGETPMPSERPYPGQLWKCDSTQ